MKKIIRDFFWTCSGANKRILIECENDHPKYTSIGASIFFTAIFATLSGGYALYFVFSGSPNASIFAALFGVLWGCCIFNLDRLIVLNMVKDGNPLKKKELILIAARFALALLVGIVIARPLELKIFEKEINEELKKYYIENQHKFIQKNENIFQSQFQTIIDDLNRKEKERDNAYKEWEKAKELRDQERFGIKTARTTGIPTWGPETEKLHKEVLIKQAIYDSLYQQVDRLEKFISQKRSEAGLTKVNAIGEFELDQLVKNAGFFDRNKMLSRISSWTPLSLISLNAKTQNTLTTNLAENENDKTVFFISLLIILIECMPIIVKIMTKRTEYDQFVERESLLTNHQKELELQTAKLRARNEALAQREVDFFKTTNWIEDMKWTTTSEAKTAIDSSIVINGFSTK